jgi:drug/metabolite transporter (DMT)-like permease
VQSRARGSTLLLAATALWGSQFAVIKTILPGASPAIVNAGRFAIAAAALAPFARRGRRIWAGGAELGGLLFAGYTAQVTGLHYTTMNRNAFITSMAVLFVPLLGAMIGRPMGRLVWLAAMVGLLGCGLMCYDGSRPNPGDFWTLAAALLFAVYMVRMETVSPEHPSLALAAAQIIVVMVLSMAWATPEIAHLGSLPWLGLLYLGLLCTALTTWMQAVAQKTVPAPQTAILFTLEPVFAAAFGFALLGEKLGFRGIVGAAMIMVSAAAVCMRPGDKASKHELHVDRV